MILGPDVSGYQGKVDWSSVVSSGRLFAFCKVSEGKTFKDDSFTESRRDSMHKAGLKLIGFYHFARPGRNTPEEEAQHFLSLVGSPRPNEVAALDLEAPGEINYEAGQWAAKWCEIVEAAGWPPVIIYANGGDLNTMDTRNLGNRPLWIAGYPSYTNLDRWKNFAFHQYTDKAVIPGISTPADESIFGSTIADLEALTSKVTTPLPEKELELKILRATSNDALYMQSGVVVHHIKSWDAYQRLVNKGLLPGTWTDVDDEELAQYVVV